MSDRIDPGPGWRLLEAGEIRERGDEFFRNGWRPTVMAGEPLTKNGFFTRRRTAPRTTKAIATRATVTLAFRDGRVVTRMERNDSGLLGKQMADTMHAWNATPLIGAKYIMLEIQREGEP